MPSIRITHGVVLLFNFQLLWLLKLNEPSAPTLLLSRCRDFYRHSENDDTLQMWLLQQFVPLKWPRAMFSQGGKWGHRLINFYLNHLGSSLNSDLPFAGGNWTWSKELDRIRMGSETGKLPALNRSCVIFILFNLLLQVQPADLRHQHIQGPP